MTKKGFFTKESIIPRFLNNCKDMFNIFEKVSDKSLHWIITQDKNFFEQAKMVQKLTDTLENQNSVKEWEVTSILELFHDEKGEHH